MTGTGGHPALPQSATVRKVHGVRCPEPSDAGLPAEGQAGALTLYLKLKIHRLPGSGQQHLLHAAILTPARPGSVHPRGLCLPLTKDTAPARGHDEPQPFPPEATPPNHFFLSRLWGFLFTFDVAITETELQAHEVDCQSQAYA